MHVGTRPPSCSKSEEGWGHPAGKREGGPAWAAPRTLASWCRRQSRGARSTQRRCGLKTSPRSPPRRGRRRALGNSASRALPSDPPACGNMLQKRAKGTESKPLNRIPWHRLHSRELMAAYLQPRGRLRSGEMAGGEGNRRHERRQRVERAPQHKPESSTPPSYSVSSHEISLFFKGCGRRGRFRNVPCAGRGDPRRVVFVANVGRGSPCSAL